jgi:MHS family proline/betaine transporter-like MFS transporter
MIKNNPSQTKRLLSLILGNMLEFYDFTIFVALLPIIAPILFPSSDKLVSLTSGYLFLAVGFLMRPFGAYLFGSIGDKYGRKKALLLSMIFMAVATTTIGLLPSYSSIGVASYIILAMCRLVQGLSAGGEYTGAGLGLVENEKGSERVSKSGVLTASGIFGAFLAMVVAFGLSLGYLPQEAWRLAFLAGGALGFYVLWLRQNLDETEEFKTVQAKSVKPVKFSILLKKYPDSMFNGMMIGACLNAPFYLLTGFVNSYSVAIGLFERSTIMLVNSLAVLAIAVGMVICSRIKIAMNNPLPWMKKILLAQVVTIVPLMIIMFSGNLYGFAISQFLAISLMAMFSTPAFAVLSGMFPVEIRYRGAAVSVMIGNAVFGGFCPMFSAYLVSQTGLQYAPAFYIMALGLVLLKSLNKMGNSDISTLKDAGHIKAAA